MAFEWVSGVDAAEGSALNAMKGGERLMPLKSASGDDIQLGDQVDYDGLRRSIELLADPEAPGAAEDWHVQQFGSGVLIAEPTVFGLVFVSAQETDDSLVLVERKA